MKAILITPVRSLTAAVFTAKTLILAAILCFLNTASAGIKPAGNVSSIATLNSLSFNPAITRTTVPGPDFKDYTATVAGHVSSVKVTPVTTDPAATVTVNGTLVASGMESAAISLNVGTNTIVTKVTASDGVTFNKYSITITRQPPPVVTLNSLRFNPAVTTTTVAGPDFRDYTATVTNSIDSVTVTPTVTDPAATVKVNGIAVASGAPSGAIALQVGSNTITTIVTGSDGITTATYNAVITRRPSSVATLSSLKFSPTLQTTVIAGADFRDYTATVDNSVTSVKVTPVTSDEKSGVKINGVAVASGAASAAIPLIIGSNTITTVVTAADGVTKLTYKTVISRQGNAILSQLIYFCPFINSKIANVAVPGPYYKNYRATVNFNIYTIQVEPVAEASSSTIKVNGVTVASGGKSEQININEGDNTITTVVTAADGVTVNTYNFVITKLAYPLALLTTYPVPDVNKTVPYTASSIKIIPGNYDPQYNVRVRGVIVRPGDTATIPLKYSYNQIYYSAETVDGETLAVTYMVVYRAFPPQPTLSSFAFTPALDLVKQYGTDFADYGVTVADTLKSIKVTPVTADSASTVTVNGAAVLSGHLSAAIPIVRGNNVVSIKVTASDHISSSVYKVTVTKPHLVTLIADPKVELPNHGGFLPLIQVSGGHTKDYTLALPYSVKIVSITATAADSTSVVDKGPGRLTGSTEVITQQYDIGVSQLDIRVTSVDNLLHAVYRIAITRAGPPNDVNLSSEQWYPAIGLTDTTDASGAYFAGTAPNSVNRAYVTVVPQDPFATASMNGKTLTSAGSDYFPLIVGTNTFFITITSSNGLTTKTYRTVLTRLPPAMNTLVKKENNSPPPSGKDSAAHLNVSPTSIFADAKTNSISSVATLNSLSFDPAIDRRTVAGTNFRDYTATVQNSVSTIKVIPVATDPNATIKVNGVAVLSGGTSASIPLHVGTNTITTRVTATDGSTSNLYSMVITRLVPATATLNSLSFSPDFARVTVPGADFRDYTATVPAHTSAVSVIPVTTDPASTVKVNGITVPSGTATAPISLAVGTNTITTVVTASDGITTNVYSTVITRPEPPVALLYALYFSPGIIRTYIPGDDFRDYTATVPWYVTSITVTPVTIDPSATVTINGVPVASAVASRHIKLNVGSNVIKAVATASDGVTMLTYSVTITRQSDAFLKSFRADGAEEVAGPDYKDYAVTVSSSQKTYFVVPVLQDPSATIKVNGVPVLSGNQSPSFPLITGANTISTVVTGADSVTKNTYKVVVTRLAPVAPAVDIRVTGTKPLVRVPGPDFQDFTTSVDSNVTYITITATLVVHENFFKGRIIINGTNAESGRYVAVNLISGINIITIKVSGEDTSATNVYKITLTKPHTEKLVGGDPVFVRNDGAIVELKAVTGTHFRDLTGHVPSYITTARLNIQTADQAASVKVNGVSGSAPNVFASNFSLKEGVNTFSIVVTSFDGLRKNVYNVVITRERPGYDATLASNYWSPDLFPVLVAGPDEKDWTAHVYLSFSSVQAIATLDDPQSTMKINGVAFQSNIVSAPIPLKVGDNIIAIVVTSRNGLNSKTYKLTLRRFSVNGGAQPALDQAGPAADNVLVVHQNLSPNGDGMSDRLMIDGIAAYPDNKLSIIDKSGALVYQVKGYDNVNRVFDGTSNITGRLQHAGTYFYSLDYKASGQLVHKTGYIIIKY